MRLDDERYEFIKGEIVNLYERYNVRCIPISGFELAHKMGLKPIPYSALTENQYNAAVKVSTDGFYIIVSTISTQIPNVHSKNMRNMHFCLHLTSQHMRIWICGVSWKVLHVTDG